MKVRYSILLIFLLILASTVHSQSAQEFIKSYKVGKDIYNIPENESSDFLKDYPEAQEIKIFSVAGKRYDIPESEVDMFKSDMPEAKPLHNYRLVIPQNKEQTQQSRGSGNFKLYKNLLDSKRLAVDDLGDFDTFNMLLSDPTKAIKLHDELIKKGFKEAEIGNQADFLSNINNRSTTPPNNEFIPPEALVENKPIIQQDGKNRSDQDQINKKVGENIILFFSIFLSGLILVLIIWIFNKILKMKQIKNAELIDFEKELLIQQDDQITEVTSVTISLVCSNCGIAILKDAKFCSTCGSPNSNAFQTNKAKVIDLEAFERLATFKERLLAKLLDLFFLIVIMTFTLPAILEFYPEYPQNQWILIVVGTVITILYHSIWLSSSYQATPGRFLKHLQVVRTDSKIISFPFAVLRDLAEWITTATFFIGYLLMLINKDKMTLHDYMVGTIVVKRKPDIKKESIYFHYRNIVYLGYGGILMGFFTIFLSGKTMSEVDKIGGYIGGVISVYAILLVVLFFKYIKKTITGQWTNNQYNITWPIFLLILVSYIYNTINP